jgi:sugar O-acyltransferase (sialic acid O-acetyltransferase NeuD family)
MKKNIVLFGGGNHLQYSLDIIERENKYNIIGVIDSIRPIGTELFGYRIIGRQEDIIGLIEAYNIDCGIITIGDNWIRHLIYNDIISRVSSFEFVNAIHPSVIIGNNVTMGVGIIAMAGCIFNPGAIVENFTFFATGAQIEHDCYIGEYASVSAGSVLGGHVKIGKFSAITLNVTIVDRLSIGENTVIGAASLVTKSMPDNVLAYGAPAKIIRSRSANERFLK